MWSVYSKVSMKSNLKLNNHKQDVVFFVRFLIFEILIVLMMTLLACMLKEWTFIKAIKSMYLLCSLIVICQLGLEMFRALDQYHWNFREASIYYSIFPAIVLIVINATTCPLMLQSDKRFIVLIIPAFIWLAQILYGILLRWLK